MGEKEILLTQEGYDNLEKELDYLKTEKRTEIAERIKVALGFGDLSENSEYDEAKNAQAANETKIAELENKLRYARIIDESEIDTKTVQVGNIVRVLDVEFDEELELSMYNFIRNKLKKKKYNDKIEEMSETYMNYRMSVKKYLDIKSKSLDIKEDLNTNLEKVSKKVNELQHARFILNPMNTPKNSSVIPTLRKISQAQPISIIITSPNGSFEMQIITIKKTTDAPLTK